MRDIDLIKHHKDPEANYNIGSRKYPIITEEKKGQGMFIRSNKYNRRFKVDHSNNSKRTAEKRADYPELYEEYGQGNYRRKMGQKDYSNKDLNSDIIRFFLDGAISKDQLNKKNRELEKRLLYGVGGGSYFHSDNNVLLEKPPVTTHEKAKIKVFASEFVKAFSTPNNI